MYTTSFRDPIFNNTFQQEWIDHILYSKSKLDNWVRQADIYRTTADQSPIWRKYPHASDHFPLFAEIHVE